MIGAYGEWAAQSVPDPPRLSFRQPMFTNADAWRPVARARYREALRAGTVCEHCTFANPPGSRFCADCGRRLEEPGSVGAGAAAT